ncbi:membrane protein [Clostridium polyendosporum]|uniref:Membrane protein n=1 Tax=Clostridium polyendosporum TaxID=69208 RepID=A0A919RYM8_9CLOT|nr:YibE/F family protein [Clostridium polyendosporum]GIM27413.1 membrane protein [Clostridium polyendosporum]
MLKGLIKSESIFVIILVIINIGLLFLPTNFEKSGNGSIPSKALVIGIDNNQVEQRGIVKTGVQEVKLKILNGPFKGQEVSSPNNLKGQLELDKMFNVGDKALVVIDHAGDKLIFANVIDHYRINIEIILFIIFIALLIIFAGWTGVKSVISFVFTLLMIWKILIPGFLKGWNPVILALVVVTILIGATTYLVAGLNRKALVAFLGAFSGIVLTCIFALFFGRFFNIHGAIIAFSESLLYSGYANLDLTRIFLAGIFIASSGAIMDVTMDISVSMHEVVLKKPNISTKEVIKSGFSVARAVVGTMTTTLLLAYSGGYTGMLMVFMAQGTPLINVFNITYVAGEFLHTIIGSFGLVLVAPLTAILGGILYTQPNYIKSLEGEIQKENVDLLDISARVL